MFHYSTRCSKQISMAATMQSSGRPDAVSPCQGRHQVPARANHGSISSPPPPPPQKVQNGRRAPAPALAQGRRYLVTPANCTREQHGKSRRQSPLLMSSPPGETGGEGGGEGPGTSTSMPLPESLAHFLQSHGVDPSVYDYCGRLPRYIRLPRALPLPSWAQARV